MSQRRSEVAPDVPTFKEQGYDIELNSLRGTAAPKGLPDAVRERLVTAIAKVAANPEFQAKMKASYTPMRFLPPGEFAAALQQAEEQFQCALAGKALGREVGLRLWDPVLPGAVPARSRAGAA